MRELLLSQTNARIGDTEGHHALFAAHGNRDLTRRGSIAQCIDQHVREDLYGASRVGDHWWKMFRHMYMELKLFFGKLSFQRLKCALDEALWGYRLQSEGNLARFGSRQFLQIVHQATQTARLGMQHGPGAWGRFDHAIEQAFEIALECGNRCA